MSVLSPQGQIQSESQGRVLGEITLVWNSVDDETRVETKKCNGRNCELKEK